MPSSGKTTNLQLNKWLGSDKPKKDDFNADNQKLDEAHGSLSDSIAQVQQNLTAHSSGSVQHITQSERDAWSGGDHSITGTYQGTGTTPRKIELGFMPRFGFVFGLGEGLLQPDIAMQNSMVYSGTFGSAGGTNGITVDSSGFSVFNHAVIRPDGFTLKLNETGITYFYIAWK